MVSMARMQTSIGMHHRMIVRKQTHVSNKHT